VIARQQKSHRVVVALLVSLPSHPQRIDHGILNGPRGKLHKELLIADSHGKGPDKCYERAPRLCTDIEFFEFPLALDIHIEFALPGVPPVQLSKVQLSIVSAIRNIEPIAKTAFRPALCLIEALVGVRWVKLSIIGKVPRVFHIPPTPRSILLVREPDAACRIRIVGVRSTIHKEFNPRLAYDGQIDLP
jgi:hypothetical protein